MKEPVDHIERPRLPWRSVSEPSVTECGYLADKVQSISRDDFFRRLKDYGVQRTGLLTCMTCMATAQRWPTWDKDPRRALEREINWEAGRFKQRKGHRLRDELLAIVQLIEAHTEEFQTLLERQQWIDRKAGRSQTS